MCLQSFNRIISVKSIQRSITLKHSEKYYYSHYPGVWRHRDLSYHLSNACHIIQSSKVYWLSISSIPVKPIIFFPQKIYSFAHSSVYPALSCPLWLAHLLPHVGWRHRGAFAHGKDTSVPQQTVNSSRGGQEKGRFGVLLNKQFGEMRRKWLLEYFSVTWHLFESVVPTGGLKWFPNECCCCHYSHFPGHFNNSCLMCLCTLQKGLRLGLLLVWGFFQKLLLAAF